MSEDTPQTQAPSNDESLDDLDLVLDGKTWDEGGLEPAGPVGFKIEEAQIEKRKTKQGVPFAICSIKASIVARPGVKDMRPSNHWDDFSLNPRYIDRFKRFAAALGVKPTQGQKVNLAEVVKAIRGRSAFGVLKHDEFTHQGEKRKKAKFTSKFGKSFAEVQ